MSRGHERAAMFRDEADRERFLALLGAIVGSMQSDPSSAVARRVARLQTQLTST